jgi:hypothetical protein
MSKRRKPKQPRGVLRAEDSAERRTRWAEIEARRARRRALEEELAHLTAFTEQRGLKEPLRLCLAGKVSPEERVVAVRELLASHGIDAPVAPADSSPSNVVGLAERIEFIRRRKDILLLNGRSFFSYAETARNGRHKDQLARQCLKQNRIDPRTLEALKPRGRKHKKNRDLPVFGKRVSVWTLQGGLVGLPGAGKWRKNKSGH